MGEDLSYQITTGKVNVAWAKQDNFKKTESRERRFRDGGRETREKGERMIKETTGVYTGVYSPRQM